MSRTRIATVGVVVVATVFLVALSGAASGTDGQPILAGQPNTERNQTIVTNTSSSGGALTLRSGADTYTLTVQNTADFGGGGAYFQTLTAAPAVEAVNTFANSNAYALAANGRAEFGNGAVVFGSTSGVATVPAASSSIRVQLPAPSAGSSPMDAASHIVATLQEPRNVWVVAATPHPMTHSFTIFLSRAVSKDTQVAWFMFD